MANTLTPIIPKVVTAFQRIAMEKASLIAIAQTDFKAEEVALNETITIPIAPVVVGADRTPAMTVTAAADRVVTNTSIVITKDRKFAINFTGDDFARMRQSMDYVPASIMQAIRTCRNEIHSDLAGLHIYAAGWYAATGGVSGAATGTAGTAPFASAIDAAPTLKKFLADSLAPEEGRYLMIDTAAELNLGKLGQLVKVNEAGTDAQLRAGVTGKLSGFNVVVDNDVKLWSPVGTGTGYVANGVNAAGATSLVVKTGSNPILAGDVISVVSGGVTTLYGVTTGIAAAGTLVLSSGLVQATTDGDVVTVIAASRRNMAFHREALGLAIRLPKLPPDGDIGEHAIVTDPISGLAFRLSTYKGYGMNNYELSCAWGVKCVRPELLKLLLG